MIVSGINNIYCGFYGEFIFISHLIEIKKNIFCLNKITEKSN